MHTVQIYKGQGIQPWFVRLVSSNGQTLAHSEGYLTKWNAKRAAKRNFPNTPIQVIDG